jgi:hypothetical protein
VAITKPKIDGNKSWLFTSILAAVGVGPELTNMLLEQLGGKYALPETPDVIVFGVAILALAAVIHKLSKIERMLKAP